MSKKIIFLLFQPLTKRNYERFGFETFKNYKWDLECWIYFGAHRRKYKKEDVLFEDRPNFFYLHSFFQCLKIIYKLPKNFYFVDFWQPNFSCFLLQSLMILKGGKRIFLDVGGFPVTRNATWKMFSSQKITFTSLVWFVKKSFSIINKIIVNNFFCPKADYWFVSGNKPANIIKSKKKIYAYNLQYDQYLKIKNSPINNDFEKSIVYIDQNYEGHIDFILDDLKPPVNKFTHWESLNKFLTSLNRKLGKKIIIAAHPRRSKKDKINTKFEVVFNQTANIIKNSSLVVTHDSTAIAMAVLFKKPILFVIMDKLARTRVESFSINDFAKSLNKDVINIDDSYSLDNIDFFRIDENVYKKYFEDFIKSPYSKFTNYWVDFINYLEVENVKK